MKKKCLAVIMVLAMLISSVVAIPASARGGGCDGSAHNRGRGQHHSRNLYAIRACEVARRVQLRGTLVLCEEAGCNAVVAQDGITTNLRDEHFARQYCGRFADSAPSTNARGGYVCFRFPLLTECPR